MKGFDKNVTNQMKAMAMMLMLAHHAWKVDGLESHYDGISSYMGILLQLGLFGKICVGIFLFLSGYGLVLTTSFSGGYSVFNRLKKTLPPFWFVILFYAPCLFLAGAVTLPEVMTDAILITRNMDGSWWFMQTYVIFLICFPLFLRTLEHKKMWIPLLVLGLTVMQHAASWVRTYSDDLHNVLYYFPLFYVGMLAAKYSIFDWIERRRWWKRYGLFGIVLVVRFATGLHILNLGLIMAMITCLVDLQKYMSAGLKRTLNFLGLMSMNMWLMHMFFVDYGYHLSNPILDYIWMYCETLIAAYVVWWLYQHTVAKIIE